MCDIYVIQPKEFITYKYLVQYVIREYHIIIYSNRWENFSRKKKYQDQPFSIKKNQVGFKINFNNNGNGSGGDSSSMSFITCHKCVNKGNLQMDFKTSIDDYYGYSLKGQKNFQNG